MQGGVNNNYIDMETGLSRIRGNKKLYIRMLDMFLKSKEFEALDQSLGEKDYAKAADVAHGIKGMTGNLSLTALFEISMQLMQELKSGAPDEGTVKNYYDILSATRAEVTSVISAES